MNLAETEKLYLYIALESASSFSPTSYICMYNLDQSAFPSSLSKSVFF